MSIAGIGAAMVLDFLHQRYNAAVAFRWEPKPESSGNSGVLRVRVLERVLTRARPTGSLRFVFATANKSIQT